MQNSLGLTLDVIKHNNIRCDRRYYFKDFIGSCVRCDKRQYTKKVGLLVKLLKFSNSIYKSLRTYAIRKNVSI